MCLFFKKEKKNETKFLIFFIMMSYRKSFFLLIFRRSISKTYSINGCPISPIFVHLFFFSSLHVRLTSSNIHYIQRNINIAKLLQSAQKCQFSTGGFLVRKLLPWRESTVKSISFSIFFFACAVMCVWWSISLNYVSYFETIWHFVI